MSRESRREFNHHHHRHLDVPVVRLVLVCAVLCRFGVSSHSPFPVAALNPLKPLNTALPLE
ncbi:MAG: hypothetical protein R2857_08710 [Vampirovibrionales bacterium]